MNRFLLFAGTTEGRLLAGLLCAAPCEVTACVATGYGQSLLPQSPNLTVLAGRLTRDGIAELLAGSHYDCVFDATHPYAIEVTENCKAACLKTSTPYLRILREESADREDCVCVNDISEAAGELAKTGGAALITTGSKELAAFTAVPGYRERLFVRVLPDEASLRRCLELGFAPKNIICMQGPFSTELNLAILRQTGAECIVTKNSGGAGGFDEKYEAARLAGARLIVIGKPQPCEGVYLSAVPQILKERWGVEPAEKPEIYDDERAYFPLFVPLYGKRAAVFGAGKVAARRIAVLLRFGCDVDVIAPSVCEEIRARGGKLRLHTREYARGDCRGAVIVVAATDSREANRAIYEECMDENIPVSVADCKKECTFYFPGIAKNGGLVAGITASGRGHSLAARLTRKIEALLDEEAQEH